MNFNRDRRDKRTNLNGPPNVQNKAIMDTRAVIERRSGKDRRCDYDEQRKLVRYKLNKSASVYLKQQRSFKLLRPHTVKFAIVDISLGGCRAQYVATEMYPYKHDLLSIVTKDGKIKIEDIPFKIITDHKCTCLPDDTYLRRCGLKFGNLSDHHKQQLNYLIRDYSEL